MSNSSGDPATSKEGFPYPNAPFGATAPVLKIAHKYGVPYEDALAMYEFYLRRSCGPSWPLVHATYNGPIHSGVRNDLKRTAEYWYSAFH